MTAEDAPTAHPNLAVAEATVRIVYDPKNGRPEKWDWDELLDLSGDEYVEILKYEELGSYDEIIDTAVEPPR